MNAEPPEIIPLWPDAIPDADLWREAGPELERPRWENSRLARNVSQPTLTVFLPDPAMATGTGVVVCPGGAFHFLMMDKEGTEVANWLNAHGVAVFVLKYRVHPTPDDDEAFLRMARDPLPHRPIWIESGPWPLPMDCRPCARCGGRRSAIAAADDDLVDAGNSIALYSAWRAAGRSAELHLYAQGGHGFALWPQGLPVDGWIDRFWAWLQST